MTTIGPCECDVTARIIYGRCERCGCRVELPDRDEPDIDKQLDYLKDLRMDREREALP